MGIDRADGRLAIRAAAWALAVAILVFAFKLGAWWLTGSVALYSDALESVVNIGAAIVALLALTYSARPADHNHPYGHSKAEYLSAIFEATLIVVAAGAIVWQAVARLRDATIPTLTPTAIGFSVVATAINATLAAFLVRSGRRHRSPALVADGQHLITDVATSVGVLAGVGVAWATGFWVLDPVIAIAVAVNIVWVGWKLLRDSFGGLMDEGLDADVLAGLQGALESEMDGAIEIHDLKARPAGPRTFVEFHLVVPSAMTVEQAHKICDHLEEVVRRTIPGAQPLIHVEPEGEAQHGGVSLGPRPQHDSAGKTASR